MIANMNEKGRQTRLLATVAVLALVVCTFAVVVPSATDADVSTESAKIDAVYNSETVLTVGGSYYVLAGITTTTIDFASVTSGAVDLYIADGATVELTNISAKVTVKVHAVSDYYPYNYQVKYYNELTIIAVSDATYTIDGSTIIEDYEGSNATGSTYGVLVHSANETTYTYYPCGADAGYTTLVDNTDYVYIKNGSVEISYWDNTVKFENYVGNSEAQVSIASSAMVINDINASSGSVAVTKGSITATALTTTAVLTAACYESSGINYLYANVAAALSAASVASVTDVITYGSPSVAEPIVLTDGQTLEFDIGASASGWTIQTTVGTNTATVTVTVSASGDGATIKASSTGLSITGDAVTGEATDSDGQEIQDGIAIGSNVTITNATSDSNTFGITVVDVAYSGDLSADITVGNGSMVITADSSMRFNGGTISGTNESNPSSTLVVLGTMQYAGTSTNRVITENLSVYTTSSGKVSAYVDSMDNVMIFTLATQVINRDNVNQIFNFAAAGAIQLGEASDTDYYIFYIRDDVSFSNTTIYIPSNVMLVVGDVAITATGNYSNFASAIPVYINGADGNTRGSLTLTNVTIYSYAADGTYAADGKDSIVVMDRNSLTVNKSYMFAVVNASTNASVALNNNDSTYVNTTSEVIVGYGATLDLSGDVTKAVTVYGNLNITGSIMFSDDCKMNVYNGATVTVSGNLTIQGEANFFDGSITTVTGSLTLSNGTEGATLTVGINPYDPDDSNGADFTVSGTMTLNAPQSGFAARNELVINNPAAKYDSDNRSWALRFLVTGILTVNGQLSGEVHDQGIVNFNGVAGTGAAIVLYPGNTVSVTSVTSTMEITDANTLSESYRSGSRDVSDGNSVTLSDVRGITVTVSQASVSNGSGTDYYTIMDISGTVTSVDDDSGSYSIVETYSATHGVGRNNVTTGYVQVSDILTLGRSVQLSNAGMLNVSGTINAITAATSTVNTKDSSIINSSTGTINVIGWIIALSPIESKTGINAMYFVTSDETAEYHNYTGYATGIENAPDAKYSKVYVCGSVTADTTLTVSSGVTIEMDSNAMLTVSGDVDLVFAESSIFAGSTCTVEVEGLLTIDNVSETLGFPESNIYADVIIDHSPGKTWTSMSKALEDAEAGDVITLNRKILISTNTTIPEGVTVYTNIDVNADPENSAVITVTNRATLTVDGYLTMDIKSEGWIAFTDGGTMVVNGQFSANTWYESMREYYDDNGTSLADLAGAHYGLYVSNYNTYYISSVELAGENTYKADVIDTLVIIMGSLASGDATFAGADDEAQLNVVLIAVSCEEGDETVLDMSGSTMTLENALLMIESNTFLTGSVTAGDAVFDMSAASQVLISIPYSEDSIQTTIYAEIIGSVTLSSGEVTVDSVTYMGSEDTGKLYVQEDGSFTVASGAILTVSSIATIYNAGAFEVAGVIVFRDGATAITSTEITVSGIMDVVSFRIEADNTFRITGTLTATAGLTVKGTLILGEKPSELDIATTGELVGPATVASGGAILAYEGSDVSGAQINWNSATSASTASVTEYVINSYSYATIYTYGGSTVSIYDAMEEIDGVIDLLGWDTPAPSPANNNSVDVWYDTEVYNSVTSVCVDNSRIGSYSVVYATFPASTVSGTISKDAGIILTIDGLVIGDHNGDVSFTTSYSLSVGTHVIAWSERAGYDYSGVTLTFNGVEIANGGIIEITPDMESFTIIASGAVPSTGGTTSADSGNGLSLTDYLLIILVVLIVVMAIMVALRLMRS